MKVLIADDDGSARYLLEKLLGKWGWKATVVEDGVAALEAMEQPNPPRLLLLDWEMPHMDGLEVCRAIRKRDTLNPPYIIFLTGKRAPGDMVRALDAGASDCIRKPYDWDELHARIRVGERTLKLQDELHLLQTEMRKLAMYDMLTGIYNRRAIAERLDQELARTRRAGVPLSIGLADLDQFKEINDTWGHQTGDAAIVAFADTARGLIRKSDVIGRWGGDEFLIIALGDKENETNPLFERIRERTAEEPVIFDENEISMTVSIGVATATAAESTEELLHRADLALYDVKRNGRNGVAYAAAREDVDSKTALHGV